MPMLTKDSWLKRSFPHVQHVHSARHALHIRWHAVCVVLRLNATQLHYGFCQKQPLWQPTCKYLTLSVPLSGAAPHSSTSGTATVGAICHDTYWCTTPTLQKATMLLLPQMAPLAEFFQHRYWPSGPAAMHIWPYGQPAAPLV